MSDNSAMHPSILMLFDNRSLKGFLILNGLFQFCTPSWINFVHLNFSRKLFPSSGFSYFICEELHVTFYYVSFHLSCSQSYFRFVIYNLRYSYSTYFPQFVPWGMFIGHFKENLILILFNPFNVCILIIPVSLLLNFFNVSSNFLR